MTLVRAQEEINTAREWVSVLGKVWRGDDICVGSWRMIRSFSGEEWAERAIFFGQSDNNKILPTNNNNSNSHLFCT